MRQLLGLLILSLPHISYIYTQILYECNFDSSIENCFTPGMSVSSSIGIPGILVPNGPLSDVTSSLEPTDNGEVCKLFYRIGTYTWDMYFCNRGYCPTENNPNSQCKSGKFSSVELINNEMKSFQLKTESDGINGINQQCLVYYYYMGNVSKKIITVRKEETSGESEIIDSVTNSPFNGWIQRKISFNAETFGYKIYFEVQRTSGFSAPHIGFDEISISQGRCDNRLMIEDLTETNLTSISVETTTTVPDETTMPSTTVLTTTTSTPVETITTSISMDTTMTTTPIETTEITSAPAETSTPVQTTTTSTPVETITTSISMDTTTTTTTPIETTEITSIPAETSTITTPIASATTTPMEITTISATTTAIETSYFDTATTQETIEFSTAATSISPTTTATSPAEISTIESSSSTITTIITSSTIPISTETTSIITIPFNVSDTTIPISNITSETITTSTIMTTTTSTDEYVVISSYDKTLPYEKSHIIIMATVIPILWIAFIVAMFGVRRSTDIIGCLFHPFYNLSRQGKTWGSYELGDLSNA